MLSIISQQLNPWKYRDQIDLGTIDTPGVERARPGMPAITDPGLTKTHVPAKTSVPQVNEITEIKHQLNRLTVVIEQLKKRVDQLAN